jgi:hypothetical protein
MNDNMNIDKEDPFFRYTSDELKNMAHEEFRAYYHCIPFEEAVKKLEKHLTITNHKTASK